MFISIYIHTKWRQGRCQTVVVVDFRRMVLGGLREEWGVQGGGGGEESFLLQHVAASFCESSRETSRRLWFIYSPRCLISCHSEETTVALDNQLFLCVCVSV